MLFATHKLNLNPWLIVLTLALRQTSLVLAGTTASLASCPAGFTRLSNGCYFISTITANWSTAESICESMVTSPISGHLLTLEIESEVVAIQYWLYGQGLNKNFWMNGIVEYVPPATTYNSGSEQPIWQWSDDEVDFFGYLKYSSFQYTDSYGTYLYVNSTNMHEYRSISTSSSLNFICEASVPCLPSQDVCSNNSTCYVNSGYVQCICLPGYIGSRCTDLEDNCQSWPCQNGGQCINQVNNYTCSCSKWYTGPDCSIAVDYELKEFRTAMVWVCVSFVVFVLTFLFLLDIPVKRIKEILVQKIEELTGRKLFKKTMPLKDGKSGELAVSDDSIKSKATLSSIHPSKLVKRIKKKFEDKRSSSGRLSDDPNDIAYQIYNRDAAMHTTLMMLQTKARVAQRDREIDEKLSKMSSQPSASKERYVNSAISVFYVESNNTASTQSDIQPDAQTEQTQETNIENKEPGDVQVPDTKEIAPVRPPIEPVEQPFEYFGKIDEEPEQEDSSSSDESEH